MRKLLVTGSEGFLASRICSNYKTEFEILPLSRKELDITKENKVIEIVKSFKPDFVFHTAAIADTMVCENDPDFSYSVNVQGTINVAKACSIGKAKLIYCSSEQVYNGNEESGPYSESKQAVPNTVYGKHKMQAEKEIDKILEEAWKLRLTWLFGFPERNKKLNGNIFWNVVSAAIKNKPLTIAENEFRGMTYVYNVINNFSKILEVPYGLYNTGSENDLGTYYIAELILKEMGLENRIQEILIKDSERFKESPRDLRISNGKFKNLGIDFDSTEEGIKRCIRK